MDLGAVIRPEPEPEGLLEAARAAEAAGVDEVWLWEDCFLHGGVASAAAVLAATERVTVGIGVLPAPVRNAAFAAMEVATLERLHPGRVHAGLGHGVDEWMRQVGAKPASQLTLMEEQLLAVRALLAGETVSTEGRYVRLREVALDHPPREAPPVSAGVRGAKSLELSGRCADGTVLDSGSSPAYVRWARERIDAGRAAAGRTDPHRVTVYVHAATDAAGVTAAQASWEAVLAAGGPQAQAAGPDPDLADVLVSGDAASRRRTLDALAEAGADCVVLVAPDPATPLDLAALTAA